jgi:hypothetical protein
LVAPLVGVSNFTDEIQIPGQSATEGTASTRLADCSPNAIYTGGDRGNDGGHTENATSARKKLAGVQVLYG